MSMYALNEQKSEQFAENLMNVLNHGGVCLLMSLGHRTGLFDTMEKLPPSTVEEIARKAVLNERYVREWLAGMVTAGFVEYDPEAKTYFLPKEHAAWLTRSASPNNMAMFGQYIPVLGSVEDQIVECFEKGGGVPYSEYKRFHTVMAEDSAQTVVSALKEHILPLVPGLIDKLEQGIDVMDLGCGKGRALCQMAEWFPNSLFVGYDISGRSHFRPPAKRFGRKGCPIFALKSRTPPC